MRSTISFPLAAVCAAAFVLSSCASLQRANDEGVVRQVVDLINGGQAARLESMSATPFLLDGEIVALPADVATFWDTIVKAGFRVEGAALDRGAPVTADSYRSFADTMEVRSFFSRHVSRGARLLELRTNSGRRILIVAAPGWFTVKIIGFKGPF